MKIYYQTEYKPSGYPEYSYTQIDLDSLEFCCSEMREVWNRAIRFGTFDDYGMRADNHVNIGICDPYPEGASWDSYPITFCPFCDQKIEVVEKKRINYIKKTEKREVTDEIWEPLQP